jgi:hypothetical protein
MHTNFHTIHYKILECKYVVQKNWSRILKWNVVHSNFFLDWTPSSLSGCYWANPILTPDPMGCRPSGLGSFGAEISWLKPDTTQKDVGLGLGRLSHDRFMAWWSNNLPEPLIQPKIAGFEQSVWPRKISVEWPRTHSPRRWPLRDRRPWLGAPIPHLCCEREFCWPCGLIAAGGWIRCVSHRISMSPNTEPPSRLLLASFTLLRERSCVKFALLVGGNWPIRGEVGLAVNSRSWKRTEHCLV